jgi:hypothetical protein
VYLHHANINTSSRGKLIYHSDPNREASALTLVDIPFFNMLNKLRNHLHPTYVVQKNAELDGLHTFINNSKAYKLIYRTLAHRKCQTKVTNASE